MTEDSYKTSSISLRLAKYIHTIGVMLLQRAADGETIIVEKDEKLLTNTERLAGTSSSTISKELETIREYVRELHDIQKDYRYTDYMNFIYFFSDDNIKTRSNGDHNAPYSNSMTYFMDSVKNVLHMSEDLREGVRTLFVGENYDIKLNLVKDLVSPDSLVINARMIRDIPIPFLPSVHRITIRIPGKSKHPVLLDNYINTLTELEIVCHSEKINLGDNFLYFIADAKNLESIHIATSKSMSSKLTSAMLSRREAGNASSIKAFRLQERYIWCR